VHIGGAMVRQKRVERGLVMIKATYGIETILLLLVFCATWSLHSPIAIMVHTLPYESLAYLG
jgi:hypothetical protein